MSNAAIELAQSLQSPSPASVPGVTRALAGGQGFALTAGGQIPAALLGVYRTYTPTWTSSGTAPAIGNASVIARYTRIGKFVHAYGGITFGSTTTYGTGVWFFALPATPAASVTTNVPIGTGWLVQTANIGIATPIAVGSSMVLQLGATYLGTNTNVSPTFPWTWAASNILGWNAIYEAA